MLRATARRHRRKEAAEMNITAFMNLMVILVPFLLISAVFSRLTILQLNLPGESSGAAETQQVLNIEVIVRKDGIQVADRGTGLLKSLPVTPEGHDLKGLNEYLQVVKTKFPQKTDATVLLEPDTPYDILVQVMDAVRAYTVQQDGRFTQAELFPDISIGDAPT
ncbi:MAG: biopolymer transporter ExbD [Pseudomonadota bacterium]|jgi:Biopolymer transport protein|nr:MAG: biopolymer transporter ExbD [Pseudomonadota bacterium]